MNDGGRTGVERGLNGGRYLISIAQSRPSAKRPDRCRRLSTHVFDWRIIIIYIRPARTV